ncbi:MAG TPA: hypothetical protein PLB52_03040 [Candidatus Moranbacteria bacterium]|nr:hypothetical protein [Candidatus Moranbacteria bacterium]
MNNKQSDYSNEEVVIDVSVTSFMMTVATFFTGFLISSYDSFSNSVRIPIFFLIVSTLSFLFTNIIFANASGEIRTGNRSGANKHAITGNIISEFLGIYLLVTSLPLAINAITEDIFLRDAVFIISIVALVAYSMSPFSIIKRYLGTGYFRLLYSVAFAILWASCFLTQKGDSVAYVCVSVALISYLILTTIILLSRNKD